MIDFKHRHMPKLWNDLIFADSNTKADLAPFMSGTRVDHIILHGPYGTGKSTTAAIIAGKGRVEEWTPKLSVATPDLTEKIAKFHYASGSGIDVFNLGNPIGVVEEIDQFTTVQQQMFRQVMDQCVSARFIFTTNHFASIDTGIRSRAKHFHMALPTPQQWLGRAHLILNSEGVIATDDEILHQITVYQGDMRSTIRALEDMVSIQKGVAPVMPQPITAPAAIATPNASSTPAIKRVSRKKLVKRPATVGQILRKTP